MKGSVCQYLYIVFIILSLAHFTISHMFLMKMVCNEDISFSISVIQKSLILSDSHNCVCAFRTCELLFDHLMQQNFVHFFSHLEKIDYSVQEHLTCHCVCDMDQLASTVPYMYLPQCSLLFHGRVLRHRLYEKCLGLNVRLCHLNSSMKTKQIYK